MQFVILYNPYTFQSPGSGRLDLRDTLQKVKTTTVNLRQGKCTL